MFFLAWQKYCQEIMRSFAYDPPDWNLDHETIWEAEARNLKLLQFQEGKKNENPILVVPPNAGHHSNIAEKLISTCMRKEGPVYAIDHQNQEKNYSIDDMVRDIHTCYEKIGKPVHFISLCQGAWATAICISLFPECALSYTNAAGPIKFQTKEGKIDAYTRLLPMSFFENMVNMGGGFQLGLFQIMGFKNLNPYERWVGDYLELFQACLEGDEKKIEKWHRFKRWYEYGVDISGQWYLEAVRSLFKEDRLIKGEVEVLDRKVDLNEIKCPIFLVAGEEDDITLPEQVFVLNATQEFLIEDVGHIGVFTSRKSQPVWEEILGNLN